MNATEPLPSVDADAASQPFFDAAREGRLVVQRCTACQTLQLGNVICDHCFARQFEWIAASGRATVHSFVVMHLSYHRSFEAPYCGAIAELEEGPRLPVYLADQVRPRIGQKVTLRFAASEAGTAVPVAYQV
ncbi:OB-fold domain-containing protein [Comamonadaceae bacterium G21597-S1]|nr:OB-fold domain-containing protein [Comamonadaceae bacterium G21597-S1]